MPSPWVDLGGVGCSGVRLTSKTLQLEEKPSWKLSRCSQCVPKNCPFKMFHIFEHFLLNLEQFIWSGNCLFALLRKLTITLKVALWCNHIFQAISSILSQSIAITKSLTATNWPIFRTCVCGISKVSMLFATVSSVCVWFFSVCGDKMSFRTLAWVLI